MRNATECAPKTCKCGKKLPKPVYGYPWLDETCQKLHVPFDYPHYKSPTGNDKVWFMCCSHCGTIYVWSYHEKSTGCWKIRAILTLFDTKEIVVIA